MGIKSYNPYTPSRRHMTGSDFSEITAAKPEKSSLVSLKKNAGRNNQGKITVRHIRGGSRRKYRIIDFKRRKDGIPATVKTIEYDPNRTANIALISYADGEKAYILAPEGLKVGQKVYNGPEAESVLETACHWSLSRLVLWFTTLSFILEKADRWFVLQETVLSSWLKKESSQH